MNKTGKTRSKANALCERKQGQGAIGLVQATPEERADAGIGDGVVGLSAGLSGPRI